MSSCLDTSAQSLDWDTMVAQYEGRVTFLFFTFNHQQQVSFIAMIFSLHLLHSFKVSDVNIMVLTNKIKKKENKLKRIFKHCIISYGTQ